MVKRPKEVRLPKGNDHCVFCKDDGAIRVERGWMCDDCFHSYCEICNKIVEYITVRRDLHNKEHTHSQCCSDCYLAACHDILRKDAEYSTDTVSDRKK